MTANQARMVLDIAAAYGEELSMDRARELLGVLAAGFGLRALSRQAVKLVPVAGWAASAVIAYAGTVAMGRTGILYFERGKQEVGAKEMARIRTRAIEEGKALVSRMRQNRFQAEHHSRESGIRDVARIRPPRTTYLKPTI